MAPTSNELPGSTYPGEGEYSDTCQTSPTNPNSSQHHVPQLAYPSQPTFYAPYNQPATGQDMGQMPYPYQPYSPMSGPLAAQLTESPHPTSPYVGSYGAQIQPTLGSHRVNPPYYPQPTPSPTIPTEGSYGHQYIPFRQTHIGLPYLDTSQSSSSQLPRLISPDQILVERHARREEVNYDSISSSYRHIMSTVSQAPSPTADSPGQSIEQPVVEGMLHRAVEGLRYLDPTRAEQYGYPGEVGAQPIASGAVGPESPSETVFVRYYEDGKTESTPTKKKMKKRAKEEEKLSPGGSPRRVRSKGKSRELTEESEEDREQGSDDTLPPMAGPSGMSGGGNPS
ncbi:unnamed protein product [Rhizoctonia solani]|uniref:Uncharacterized protein n=1 Tax=Rhizoctonia solani TaxID=456999 RepID=A0A8H3BHI8_9AGAM|nr:unnamed protein product [Rhizoctonia solani]